MYNFNDKDTIKMAGESMYFFNADLVLITLSHCSRWGSHILLNADLFLMTLSLCSGQWSQCSSVTMSLCSGWMSKYIVLMTTSYCS